MLFTYIHYKDIIPNRYLITSDGDVFNVITGKKLSGNNPDNEKGYIRIALKTTSGQFKKFPLHVLVINSFSDEIPKEEVNHINGNKRDPSLANLEYTSRLENAYHAKIHNLYRSGEDIYRSNFTNDEVHKICHLMELGYSISEIINIMQFPDSYLKSLTDILHKKSWIRISSLYNIDYNRVHYKVYEYSDLCEISRLIASNMKPRYICALFPQYDEVKLKKVIKKMRQKKLYRSITKAYF